MLRAPEVGDEKRLWPLVSNNQLTTFLSWEAHRSIKETTDLVANLIDAQHRGIGFHWLVNNAEETIGLVSLIDVHWKHRSWVINRAELAYWIGLPFQGSGYATESAAAIMKFGFEKLKLHKIRVYHAADNPLSGRTIAKLGFRFVGEEKDAFQKNGTWHHLNHFELLKSEFTQFTDQTFRMTR